MKCLIAGLLCLIVLTDVQAQYPKLIVEFSNKNGSPHSINTPGQYLSARAMARRNRYNIAIDSFDLPVVPRYIDSVLAQGNVHFLSSSRWLNQILIECTDPVAINRIRALPFVKQAVGIGFRPAVPQEPRISDTVTALNTWPRGNRILNDVYNYGNNFAQVNIHEGEFLHNRGFSGQGIVIGVLDAGFLWYKNVTAFDSVRLNGQILGERDFVAFDNSVNEDDAHGMYCLSIMCANWPGQMVGTAPKAAYWLIRTENASSEYPIEEHNWVVGAEFLDSVGADMISSSLGYTDFDDPAFDHTYSQFYKNATMVSKGATMAAKKGMIVMNSAGNEGNRPWKYIGFPADADSVCAVGAVTAAGTVASFSSFGYPGKVKPNIASVGAGTVVAGLNNMPVMGNGTSFSNPNIAGLIACLWQAFPEFNNMQILDAVYRSSSHFNNPNDRIGYGIPNMRVAYQLLLERRNAAFEDSWLIVTPNPLSAASRLQVRFKSPETGKVALRLVDINGRTVEQADITVTEGMVYNTTFSHTGMLAKGLYFVQFIGRLNKKTVKFIRM